MLPVSVVIPAHDEAAVIERCLEMSPSADAAAPVRSTSSSCATAAPTTPRRVPARIACPDATVIELPVAVQGRRGANAGDDRCTDLFPRIYLDADIELSTDALRATVRALTEPGTLCAAPVPNFELHGRPGVVRRYYEVWQQLPYITDDMVGTGVYGLSAAGRDRFGEFPSITADDQFVLQHFERGERRTVSRRVVHRAHAVDDPRLARHPPTGVSGCDGARPGEPRAAPRTGRRRPAPRDART